MDRCRPVGKARRAAGQERLWPLPAAARQGERILSGRVLVTGAAGFIGRALCSSLSTRHQLRLELRRDPPPDDPLRRLGEIAVTGDIGPDTDWAPRLVGVSTVVHLANIAHARGVPEARCREINVEGSRNLAAQAAKAGVARLVYLSSVKVLGEKTGAAPFDETSTANPVDAYGRSKWQAELALSEVARASDLELVILRPPLVYGPGVGANFLRLARWVARGRPVPLAAATNRRSLLFVGNLASAIELCLEHPAAADRTYLLRDSEDLSVAELVRGLGLALDKPARLFPVPPSLLRVLGGIVGRAGDVGRLLDSLAIDDGLIRRELGWSPPHSVAEGLKLTAASLFAA